MESMAERCSGVAAMPLSGVGDQSGVIRGGVGVRSWPSTGRLLAGLCAPCVSAGNGRAWSPRRYLGEGVRSVSSLAAGTHDLNGNVPLGRGGNPVAGRGLRGATWATACPAGLHAGACRHDNDGCKLLQRDGGHAVWRGSCGASQCASSILAGCRHGSFGMVEWQPDARAWCVHHSLQAHWTTGGTRTHMHVDRHRNCTPARVPTAWVQEHNVAIPSTIDHIPRTAGCGHRGARLY